MPQSAPLPKPSVVGVTCVELTADHVDILQRFFEGNPFYFESVMGEPAQPGEADEEIHGELPTGWPFTKKWFIGYVNEDGALVAVASIVSDLLAKGVWHIGLFIVASSLHGTGCAQSMYDSLEAWAQYNGAHWLRLGVVADNPRAERFWQRQGFIQVRTREDVSMGKRINTIRVLIKSLAQQPLERYLAIVERDRPNAA
jgi:RimJ/RimL family protein N-acetyltransferase